MTCLHLSVTICSSLTTLVNIFDVAQMQLTALYTITLVSYANNLPWLTSLRTLKHGAHIWGFDRTLLWEERDFQNDDLASRLPPIGSPRCHCATFKPLMLMRATSKHAINDNDYVLWADSSHWYDYTDISLLISRPTLTSMIERLNGFNVYGSAVTNNFIHAPLLDNPNLPADDADANLHKTTLLAPNHCAYSKLLSERPDVIPMIQKFTNAHHFMQLPLINDAHMFMKITSATRQVVRAWLDMALELPEFFCSMPYNDQDAWNILMANLSLPAVNTCSNLGLPLCLGKHLGHFLRSLASGRFDVVESAPLPAQTNRCTQRAWLRTNGKLRPNAKRLDSSGFTEVSIHA
jgi:hypothetical protein